MSGAIGALAFMLLASLTRGGAHIALAEPGHGQQDSSAWLSTDSDGPVICELHPRCSGTLMELEILLKLRAATTAAPALIVALSEPDADSALFEGSVALHLRGMSHEAQRISVTVSALRLIVNLTYVMSLECHECLIGARHGIPILTPVFAAGMPLSVL